MSVDDARCETPSDAEALSRTLAALSRSGARVRVRGGDTKPALGLASAPADLVLSTAQLDEIDVVDAEEGVAHAGAGVTLARLRAAAATVGWGLGLDPASGDSTLGGVLAAAEVGPRLRGFGRPRDVVLGLEVVLPTGERTRCGGRVVKNVTGYDLAKLHCGALGTLGVIEGAWLRLHKPPEAARTLVLEAPDAASAVVLARAAADLATARAVVVLDAATARSLLPDAVRSDGPALVVELAGAAPVVAAHAERLARGTRATEPARASDGECELLDRIRTWHRAAFEGGDLAVRIGGRPSRTAALLVALPRAGASVVAHPFAGLVFARLPLPPERDDDALRAALAALDDAGRTAEASLRLEGGPEWARRPHALFAPSGAVREISRSIARRFDPAGVLSAERAIGDAGAA